MSHEEKFQEGVLRSGNTSCFQSHIWNHYNKGWLSKASQLTLINCWNSPTYLLCICFWMRGRIWYGSGFTWGLFALSHSLFIVMGLSSCGRLLGRVRHSGIIIDKWSQSFIDYWIIISTTFHNKFQAVEHYASEIKEFSVYYAEFFVKCLVAYEYFYLDITSFKIFSCSITPFSWY